MRQKRKRANTLLGLFAANFRVKAVEMIRECKMVSNVTKKTSPLQLLEIVFVLKRGDKVKVYREMIRIIANGSLAVSKRESWPDTLRSIPTLPTI